MSNLTTEGLTKLIYEKLENLEYEIILSNPTTQSKFPAVVINTPLENVIKRQNTEVLQKRFQVTIECWADKKYKVMEMLEEISQALIDYNFIRTNTISDIFDEITKKYRLQATFEVKYNGITNSFM